MNQDELPESTDQPLPVKEKKAGSSAKTNSLFIGAMIGIVIWSVAHNTVSVLTLIPLFLAYQFINSADKQQ